MKMTSTNWTQQPISLKEMQVIPIFSAHQKQIEYIPVETQSGDFFSRILSTDTPHLALTGQVWGACCEYKSVTWVLSLSMSCYIHHCDCRLYCNKTQLYNILETKDPRINIVQHFQVRSVSNQTYLQGYSLSGIKPPLTCSSMKISLAPRTILSTWMTSFHWVFPSSWDTMRQNTIMASTISWRYSGCGIRFNTISTCSANFISPMVIWKQNANTLSTYDSCYHIQLN